MDIPVAVFVSDIAIFVLKRDVKLQLTNSCSSLELELELEAVGLRSNSFLVPNLVEFSSRDLKVLIVSASMTSCDKWFQFCSTR